jgi:hypothetical protein
VVDATNNRVGVGTASPSQKLTVVGNLKSAGAQASNVANVILTRADVSWSINNETDLRVYTGSGDTDSPSTKIAEFGSTGDFRFNSGYGSVATAYGCRAWVQFNGVGTVSIRGSGNVSSVNDVGTGHYGVIFANAMPNTNYAVATSVSGNTNNYMRELHSNIVSTSEVRILHFFSGDNANTTMALADADPIHVSIFR